MIKTLYRWRYQSAQEERPFGDQVRVTDPPQMDLIRVHKDDIDVILLDVTLPGRSSREVFKEAQRLPPNLKWNLKWNPCAPSGQGV